MKKFRVGAIATVVAFACFTSTGAAQSAGKELKGRTLCIDSLSINVVVTEPLALNIKTLESRVRAELIRRLTLSRINFSEEDQCDLSATTISIQATSGPTRGWVSAAVVEDWGTPAYPSYARFWEDRNFGVVAFTGTALEDYLFQKAQAKIESLALAWIKANP